MGILDAPALSPQAAAAIYAPITSISKKSAQAAKAVTASAPVLMASPPTITVPASGTAQTSPVTSDSLLTAPMHLDWNNYEKFRYLGGIPSQTGSFYAVNSYMLSANSIKSTMRVSWYSDAPDFEFLVRHTDTNGAVRLMVDGQWAGASIPCTTGDGQRRSIRVQPGTRRLRLYQLECDQVGFGGVNITAVDTVVKGPPPVVRSVFFGDSFVQGSGAIRPGEGLSYKTANLLGWDDAYTCGMTGTGYLRPTTTPGFSKFIDRIPTFIAPLNPGAIVVLGGLNDNTYNDPSYTPAALGTAATAFYAALNAAAPTADVFVVGPATAATPSQTDRDKNAAVKAAALAQPNVKLFLDPTKTTDPWITGTGKVGATNGSGNADVLTSTDGTHPSPDGHEMYAARISNAIKSYYLGVAA